MADKIVNKEKALAEMKDNLELDKGLNIDGKGLEAFVDGAIENGNEVAKAHGYADVKDMETKLASAMARTGTPDALFALKAAKDFFADFIQLCLNQEIESSRVSNNSMVNFVNMFPSRELREGNSYQFSKKLITGTTDWNSNKDTFVPTETTQQINEVQTLNFFQADGETITADAYQNKKELCIQDKEYFQYFKSGALVQYLAQLKAELEDALLVKKYDFMARKITEATYHKTINSSALNSYEALIELFDNLRKMEKKNSVYTVGTTKAIQSVNKEDIVIFMNTKTLNMIENGIQTQLYNQEFLGPWENWKSNIRTFENKFVIGDQNTAVSVGDEQYIGENDIIVIDTKGWLRVNVWEGSASQFFAKNYASYFTNDEWGMFAPKKWAQGFKFSCANLNKLPTK